MGLIQIYCGNGKGKTTASVGLGVRAAGRKIPVVFAQFLKGDTSGEIGVLRQIPGITVLHAPHNFGFTGKMNGEQRSRAKEEYEDLFRRACETAAELADGMNGAGGADGPGAVDESAGNTEKVSCLLVLDEAAAVCKSGLLDPDAVTKWLREKPSGLEVVLTGRDPNPAWVELADYVSEVSLRKHPYEKGIHARKGIEF